MSFHRWAQPETSEDDYRLAFRLSRLIESLFISLLCQKELITPTLAFRFLKTLNYRQGLFVTLNKSKQRGLFGLKDSSASGASDISQALVFHPNI
jgi:hypothetical protein